MKLVKISLALMLLATFATASVATAGSSEKSFNVPYDMTLDGVELTEGRYKIRWEGEGSAVNVAVLKKGEVLVETTATVHEMSGRNRDAFVKVMPLDHGAFALTEVRPQGKKFSLRFSDSVAKLKASQRGTVASR